MKRTFKYCGNHKEDEAYMQQMCARGWAAQDLVEGVWSFEPCRPNEYCYRICYLRGRSREEIERIKAQNAAKGIAFVSQYSFWAIFRSSTPFELYTPEEEREICRRIYVPMPIGAAVALTVCAGCVFLAFRFSPWFWLPAALSGVYGAVCGRLAISYRKLLRRM